MCLFECVGGLQFVLQGTGTASGTGGCKHGYSAMFIYRHMYLRSILNIKHLTNDQRHLFSCLCVVSYHQWCVTEYI